MKKTYRFRRAKSVLESNILLCPFSGRFFNALTPRPLCINPSIQAVVIAIPIIPPIICMMSADDPMFFISATQNTNTQLRLYEKSISTKNQAMMTTKRSTNETIRRCVLPQCAFNRNLINYRGRHTHWCAYTKQLPAKSPRQLMAVDWMTRRTMGTIAHECPTGLPTTCVCLCGKRCDEAMC